MYSLSRLFRGVLCSAATDEGKREVCIVLQSGGALGFSVLLFWLFLDRFFGFCSKNFDFLCFAVYFDLRIICGLAFGFRFSSKTQTGFGIFPVCIRSWRQFSPSAGLEQPRNAKCY